MKQTYSDEEVKVIVRKALEAIGYDQHALASLFANEEKILRVCEVLIELSEKVGEKLDEDDQAYLCSIVVEIIGEEAVKQYNLEQERKCRELT